MGWFNGDPVDLFPHTPRERAERMLELVGEKKLLAEAEDALKDDPQWTLELSSYVLNVSFKLFIFILAYVCPIEL